MGSLEILQYKLWYSNHCSTSDYLCDLEKVNQSHM